MAPERKSVRITVKSDLAELQGINIEHRPIDVEVTWQEFFRFYNIQFDGTQHAIKSSRHLAYGEDLIQETANWFQRGVFSVKIVKWQPAVKPKHALVKRLKRVRGSPRIPILVNKGLAPATSTPTPSSPRNSTAVGQAIVPNFGPSPIHPLHLPNNNEATGSSQQAINGRLVVEDLRMDRPSTGSGKHRIENQNFQVPVVTVSRTVSKRRYTESIVSQESQDPDPEYCRAKRLFMEMGARVRNEDWNTISSEVERIKNMDPEVRFRWTRKIPLLSQLLFSWADQNKK